MPTAHRRTQVTHTESVRHALDVAQQRWPGEKQSTQLTRLIEVGASALESSASDTREERRRKALALAGRYRGTFATGYLDEIRAGWPE